MSAAVWFLRSSAWDITAIAFLIVHFKGLRGGEMKSAAIIFFCLFLIPHDVPVRVSHADSTWKNYCKRMDKYYIWSGIPRGIQFLAAVVVEINVLFHYPCFPHLETVVTQSESSLITVEEQSFERVSANFTKFLLVQLNHVLPAFSRDFCENLFFVGSCFWALYLQA